MSNQKLQFQLNRLLSLPSETEVIEFKEAKTSLDFGKIGKYFSALSNEANLKGKQDAWLVFGVEDKHKNIVGTQFRSSSRFYLDKLKGEIANKTTNRITFIEIHELLLPEGRVVMFQIPAAPKGVPIAWEGHYYGRDGQELSPLNIEEYERIRQQATQTDWSKAICEDATVEDLDPKALLKARENYKSKFPEQATDVDTWDDITFLNKAKVTIKGQITRAAILLLGKSESEHFINPAEAKIRWILKDNKGNEKDYSIFNCPFLLEVDKVFNKIRNLKYRYIRDNTLFPDEVDQYEPFVIREAINNCIAHQDYVLGGRINVVEKEDELIFTNLGAFIPLNIENVIKENAPQETYRNPFLVTAMFNLKMVDTIGSGIRRMFNYQRIRFFPMPEYDFSDNRVKLTITGKVLDIDYAKVLARYPALSLEEIIWLDKIVKNKQKQLSSEEVQKLKSKKLIEGRKPNYFISATIAKATGEKADYFKRRGIDDGYCQKIIIEYLRKFKEGKREDFERILLDKLPDVLDIIQKKNKIKNNLQLLRKQGYINIKGKIWIMSKS